MKQDDWLTEERTLLDLRAALDRSFNAFSEQFDAGNKDGQRAAREVGKQALSEYQAGLARLAARGKSDWDVRRRLLGLAWRKWRAKENRFARELAGAAFGRIG
mgnify:CR=1 FL=1|tara:strand:+ start:140 stop:448 length:309 start_codon:yes stop_codon:yes gene_type:complete